MNKAFVEFFLAAVRSYLSAQPEGVFISTFGMPRSEAMIAVDRAFDQILQDQREPHGWAVVRRDNAMKSVPCEEIVSFVHEGVAVRYAQDLNSSIGSSLKHKVFYDVLPVYLESSGEEEEKPLPGEERPS
jgi:hypothetical protein